jgi:hypothetical protein
MGSSSAVSRASGSTAPGLEILLGHKRVEAARRRPDRPRRLREIVLAAPTEAMRAGLKVAEEARAREQ